MVKNIMLDCKGNILRPGWNVCCIPCGILTSSSLIARRTCFINYNTVFYIFLGPGNRIYPKINKVYKGNVAIFNCRSTDFVMWKLRDPDPPSRSSKKEFDKGRILVIKKVQLHHAGEVHCYGITGTDNFTAKAVLQVIGMFSCNTQTLATHQIQWLKENVCAG